MYLHGSRKTFVDYFHRRSYADNLRAAPGREEEPPNAAAVRVETLDGSVLSPAWPGSGWYSRATISSIFR
jgi:hypothetical protein